MGEITLDSALVWYISGFASAFLVLIFFVRPSKIEYEVQHFRISEHDQLSTYLNNRGSKVVSCNYTGPQTIGDFVYHGYTIVFERVT